MKTLALVLLALVALACSGGNPSEPAARAATEHLYVQACLSDRNCLDSTDVPDGAEPVGCGSDGTCKWRTINTGTTQAFRCIAGEHLPCSGGYKPCVVTYNGGTPESSDWGTCASGYSGSVGAVPAWASLTCRGNEDCTDSEYGPYGFDYDDAGSYSCELIPSGGSQKYCNWRVGPAPSDCIVPLARECITSGSIAGIQNCVSVGLPELFHTAWSTCHT